jgi:general secretion pathway protein L
MNPQTLLNADMATLSRWVRLGLSWWFRELADMVPASLRDRPSRSARSLAELTADGSVRFWKDGAPDTSAGPHGGAPRTVDLLLPPGSVLVQDMELPRLSAADTRRLVELNLDRYTPFTPDKVYFDAVPIGRPAEGARQRVRLGVIFRERGKAALAQADALGLRVERLGVAGGTGGGALEFDFMRAIRAEEGGDPRRRRRTYLWAACAILLMVNVAVAVGRDMNDVAQLQRLIDVQGPTTALALRLRRTVSAERARRIALLTQRAQHEPLRIVDAATRALPKGQWVARMEWNGRAVRLVGFKKPGFDVAAALRGPALTNPRSLLSDMPTKTVSGDEPFDIMADAAVRRGR